MKNFSIAKLIHRCGISISMLIGRSDESDQLVDR